MQNENLLQACRSYFIDNPAYKRLFVKCKQKYASLGHIGGSVTLNNLTDAEKNALGGLLRRDFYANKNAVIKLDEIQAALNQTKFNGLLLSDILNEYFGETIISNKSQRQSIVAERNSFFNEIITEFADTISGKWLLNAVTNKDNAYNLLIFQYTENKESLLHIIKLVCVAVNSLPYLKGQKIRLPLFASEITKDPHSFDMKNIAGKLLMNALAYLFEQVYPASAEQRAELYYKGGILIDDVSSHVLCKGIKSYYTTDGIHMGWDGFYNNNEALIATLSNIGKLNKATAINKKVFVVENPAVFSTIADRTESIPTSLICTNGQIRIAALVLLDLLVQDGNVIYYSGDFDPEGLQIADKLTLRYDTQLILWRFSIEDYIQAISKKSIDTKRINKMLSLNNAQLKAVAAEIESHQCAGYQESIIDKLVEDIIRFSQLSY